MKLDHIRLLDRSNDRGLWFGSFVSLLLHGLMFAVMATTSIFYPTTGNAKFDYVWIYSASISAELPDSPKKAVHEEMPFAEELAVTRTPVQTTPAQMETSDGQIPDDNADPGGVVEQVVIGPKTREEAAASAEQDMLAARKAERERLQVEKAARETEEKRLQAKELLEREQVAAEKTARDKVEQERLAKLEAEREASVKADQERVVHEMAQREKVAAEAAERQRVAEENAAAEMAEQERLAQEVAENRRLAARKTEEERLVRETEERERSAAETRERERLVTEETAKKKADQERAATEVKERAERKRLAAVKESENRLAREKAEQERVAAEKTEMARLAAEKTEQKRLAEEKDRKQPTAKLAANEANHQPPPPNKPDLRPLFSSTTDEPSKINAAGTSTETKGIVPLAIQGDMKLEIMGDEEIKIKVVFRGYPASRRNRPMTKAEARRTQEITPVIARSGETTRVAVIETAGAGIYDFVAEPAAGKPSSASFLLKLYESSSKPKTKSCGKRTIAAKTTIVKVLMPEGILWDDASAFSGSMEDSDGLTKFNSETGLVWKEYSDNL